MGGRYQRLPPLPDVGGKTGRADQGGPANEGYRKAGTLYSKSSFFNGAGCILQREKSGWTQQVGKTTEGKGRGPDNKKDV